ncbi:phytanoyl-CoA dioxygenase family protein [Micromonospora haikouensis]|uniref:phytanoyl-CoA dioxygenase family protein n=1 Tax=Micromonospora haikouensis TaxID=686309 RepID=UPI003D738051
MVVESQSAAGDSFEVEYRINDRNNGHPVRSVSVEASHDELADFQKSGYLVRRGLIPPEWISEFGAAINRIVAEEINHPSAERLPNNGLYIRSLLDKDEVFHRLIRYQPTLSVARYLLGPQVAFGLEARVAFEGVANAGVNWHIHLRVVPDPMPPYFVYPHQVHGLIYLDRVGAEEGALCVLPGSHQETTLTLPNDASDQLRQQKLYFEPGDCILMHGNLWHRTEPTAETCGRRRLILFGYSPSWLKTEVTRGVPVSTTLTDALRASDDPELVELLDGFHW